MILKLYCTTGMPCFVLEAKSQIEEDADDVEVIRCVCNIYRDEGLMILCEKCNVSGFSKCEEFSW